MDHLVPRRLGARIKRLVGQFPIVTVTGPRQSGKTTLCRATMPRLRYVSLEAPETRQFAQADPRGFLADLTDGAILDEVQRCPDLLSYLQGVVDDDPRPGRWVLTGSYNFALIEKVGQSLAGRTGLVTLLPLSWAELKNAPAPPADLWQALFMGGFPRIHAAKIDPVEWLSAYVTMYVERDVREVIRLVELDAFHRFIQVAATQAGQAPNLTAMAGDVGVSQPTIKSWLGVLEASYVILRIEPLATNLRKRLVRTPRFHMIDSGLHCRLLGITSAAELAAHPARGAIFEGWVAAEIAKARAVDRVSNLPSAGIFFVRDHRGVEVDLAVEGTPRADRRPLRLVEVKAGRTASGDWLKAIDDVRGDLESGFDIDAMVVYGGDERQRRTKATFLPWREIDAVAW